MGQSSPLLGRLVRHKAILAASATRSHASQTNGLFVQVRTQNHWTPQCPQSQAPPHHPGNHPSSQRAFGGAFLVQSSVEPATTSESKFSVNCREPTKPSPPPHE